MKERLKNWGAGLCGVAIGGIGLFAGWKAGILFQPFPKPLPAWQQEFKPEEREYLRGMMKRDAENSKADAEFEKRFDAEVIGRMPEISR